MQLPILILSCQRQNQKRLQPEPLRLRPEQTLSHGSHRWQPRSRPTRVSLRAASPVRVNITPQGVMRHFKFGGRRAVDKPKTQSLLEILKHAFQVSASVQDCIGVQVWFASTRQLTGRDRKGNVGTSPRSKIEETANHATSKLGLSTPLQSVMPT